MKLITSNDDDDDYDDSNRLDNPGCVLTSAIVFRHFSRSFPLLYKHLPARLSHKPSVIIVAALLACDPRIQQTGALRVYIAAPSIMTQPPDTCSIHHGTYTWLYKNTVLYTTCTVNTFLKYTET
jgi:hypothetical protein